MCFSSKVKSLGTEKWEKNVISSIPLYCKGKEGTFDFFKNVYIVIPKIPNLIVVVESVVAIGQKST